MLARQPTPPRATLWESEDQLPDQCRRDRNTLKRQRAAAEVYAAQQRIEIVGEAYDAAVSGADPLDARAGFVALLSRIAGNGVRTIVVESAHRFARDLIVQEIRAGRCWASGVSS